MTKAELITKIEALNEWTVSRKKCLKEKPKN